MGLVGLVGFQMIISNESVDFNDPKEFNDPTYLMNFDNPKSTVILPSWSYFAQNIVSCSIYMEEGIEHWTLNIEKARSLQFWANISVH